MFLKKGENVTAPLGLRDVYVGVELSKGFATEWNTEKEYSAISMHFLGNVKRIPYDSLFENV